MASKDRENDTKPGIKDVLDELLLKSFFNNWLALDEALLDSSS